MSPAPVGPSGRRPTYSPDPTTTRSCVELIDHFSDDDGRPPSQPMDGRYSRSGDRPFRFLWHRGCSDGQRRKEGGVAAAPATSRCISHVAGSCLPWFTDRQPRSRCTVCISLAVDFRAFRVRVQTQREPDACDGRGVCGK